MRIGLYVIGDEILSGRRQDRHLANLIALLSERGQILSWVKFLADDMDILVPELKNSFASNDLVFSAGGIGGTPDDMTRMAAAQALGIDVVAHPDGLEILKARAKKYRGGLTPERQRMVEFPEGADLIPNPVNKVPGFSIQNHYFVPGFPDMAQPMFQWVLDERYPELNGNDYVEKSLMLFDVPESDLSSLMIQLQTDHAVKAFSLPRFVDNGYRVEFGLKGKRGDVVAAMDVVAEEFNSRDYRWEVVD